MEREALNQQFVTQCYTIALIKSLRSSSRACQWLVRVSKFPMAALEAKRFGFAFDRSSSPSPSSTQPSDHGRQSSPHLTCLLGDWDKTALLDLKSASRTRPEETFGNDKSAGQGHINRCSRRIHNRTSKYG